jgi:hypothetical protein
MTTVLRGTFAISYLCVVVALLMAILRYIFQALASLVKHAPSPFRPPTSGFHTPLSLSGSLMMTASTTPPVSYRYSWAGADVSSTAYAADSVQGYSALGAGTATPAS